MGIRSLLRNAFGRSKATREETGAAPSAADKPESATIPEAREESTPAPATPEAEVPAARTAPSEAPVADPAPTTATLPAQGNRADRADRAAAEPASDAAATATPSAPAEAVEAVEEAKEPEAGSAKEAAAAEDDAVADLVSQAFDNPNPAPTATAEPASDSAGPEPEVAAEAKAEPAAEPEPVQQPEPEAEAKPEPVAAEAQPATEPEATPEPAAAPAPEAEAKPAAEQPKDEAKAAEPKTAELEAAAPEADQPAADQPEAEPEAGTAPITAPAAAASLPSVAPALVSLYKSAGSTLDKHGLATQRAAVYLVLDRSGSMRNYYKDGTVQNLAEQALGLSAHLDDDATVPVIFFSTDIDGTAEIDLTNYEGRIEELHSGLGHMGRTNYHWAINAVVEHYKKSGATAPAFVIFQTDGAPTSKPAAEKALCEAAGLPIFWQFIGFGDPDAKGFDFLRKLDDLAVPEKRAVDNAGFFHAGRDPRSLSHDALYQQLMVEFPEWLAEARTAGVLKDS
ncbi:vWA domain-containing protein [Streptomyces sp. Isolate_219]|uniref:vWA domain-containing protein n=1 Tax=Streptomyces sp. Isolate_219 TaxID=2950110 RepID=UPI0021C6802A|nr:VWA domain-containing protein [Streptomyces sp. Isolate_219]MCR8572944.1 VWA domain-containing protein [Streptomyces sp. Isolate_219]